MLGLCFLFGYSHTHTHTHTYARTFRLVPLFRRISHAHTYSHTHTHFQTCAFSFRHRVFFLATFYLPGTCPSHALSHQVNINFTHSHTHTHTHPLYVAAATNVSFMRFCAFKLLSGLYQEMKSFERNFCALIIAVQCLHLRYKNNNNRLTKHIF